MKSTTTLLLVLMALVAAPSAGADADARERTGTRINLFAGGFQVFPAGEPFHISHGWVRVLGDDQGETPANGRYGFSLAVDGQDSPADYVERAPREDPVLGWIKPNTAVHNFPAGMTGTHTFTGHWFGPCAGLVEGGYTPGPCAYPTEIMTAIAPLTITVVFTP
jgi:hypothetical protein